MIKPILCIYHGNCADGFTAAWVLRNALGEENVDFVPGFYGTSFEDSYKKAGLEYYSPSNFECLYLVDFSYKRDKLLDLARQFKKIIIIDHHKTAQEDLVNLPVNVEAMFDMYHSGAMLTWIYFMQQSHGMFHGQEPPALIQRVEDRDLWRFKFSDTRAVAAKMFSHEYTFENWDMMDAQYHSGNETGHNLLQEIFLAEGEAIERKHFKDIRELLAAIQHRGSIEGIEIPMANLPYIYSSDAGHIMGVDSPFAACYWFDENGIVFSLRSSDNGADVSEIAKRFGGGGHKHAAGFNITYKQLSDCKIEGSISLGDYYGK